MASLNYMLPPQGASGRLGRSMPGKPLLKATDFAPGAPFY